MVTVVDVDIVYDSMLHIEQATTIFCKIPWDKKWTSKDYNDGPVP